LNWYIWLRVYIKKHSELRVNIPEWSLYFYSKFYDNGFIGLSLIYYYSISTLSIKENDKEYDRFNLSSQLHDGIAILLLLLEICWHWIFELQVFLL
jgi:hypothetical protein